MPRPPGTTLYQRTHQPTCGPSGAIALPWQDPVLHPAESPFHRRAPVHFSEGPVARDHLACSDLNGSDWPRSKVSSGAVEQLGSKSRSRPSLLVSYSSCTASRSVKDGDYTPGVLARVEPRVLRSLDRPHQPAFLTSDPGSCMNRRRERLGQIFRACARIAIRELPEVSWIWAASKQGKSR